MAAKPAAKPRITSRQAMAAIGQLVEDVYGVKERDIPGILPRMNDFEKFQKRMENIEIKVNGIVIGLGIQLIGALIWLVNYLHILPLK